MSRLDLERLTADLENNPQLSEEAEFLNGEATEWQGWAQGHGYELTTEEALGMIETVGGLGDDDLENVAGGWDGTGP